MTHTVHFDVDRARLVKLHDNPIEKVTRKILVDHYTDCPLILKF